jgi:hypothetical protein
MRAQPLCLALVVLTILGPACVVDVGGADDHGGGRGDDGARLALREEASMAFVSIEDGGRYRNGFALTVSAPPETAYVVYSADGWLLGTASDVDTGFAAAATFSTLGQRTIVARAFSEDDAQRGETRATVEVLPVAASPTTVAFLSPATSGGWYENGVWLKAAVGGDVRSVRYSADGWAIGTSSDIANDFALRHTFSQTGDRRLLVEGLNEGGQVVARAERPIRVVADAGDTPASPVSSSLPYFYQYANRLHPGASCQNTSIAMVLASFGWRGAPDDVTARHGKDRAQSPAGLAAVFNEEADRAGISPRLRARTNGTIAELRALLAAGRPVIVHGYFTDFGHVLVARSFDGDSYTVNDPAGTWNQRFGGGYPHGWEPSAGRGIRYPRAAFERAIASFDGATIADGSLWFHELN